MSKQKLKDQKDVLGKRATGLAQILRKKLKDDSVDDYLKTVSVVEGYIKKVEEDFGAYVQEVKKSTSTPGRPCKEDEIWCLPLRQCTRVDDCERHYEDAW